jgi:beta-1,4-N-acetylglucosaminyltransferase
MLAVAAVGWIALAVVALLVASRMVLRRRSDGTVPTVVVLGSGGHTTEMLRLIAGLDPAVYRPLTLVVATTDTTSRTKAASLLPEAFDARWTAIPRAREVGQSFRSSVFTTLGAAIGAVAVVARARPALVLANGPGTCVPVAVLGFLGGSRLVFVESWCRVESLSLTGRILYPLAHRFVVHWPALARTYPRAEFRGRLC